MPPKKAKRVNQPLQAPLPPKHLPTDDTPVDLSDKEDEPQPPAASETALARAERFKALRAKLAASSKANHNDVIAEHKRMKVNPTLLTRLDRKKTEAELKLAKHDAEDKGEDFERRRAWDWTIEESEAWDRRNDGKQQNRDEAGFTGTTFLMSC
jgi:pre-mRNA-splicing factor SYF2